MANNGKDVVMTIRVPEPMAERLQELRDVVAEKRAFVMKSTHTRSDLVRYVMLRGIESLEEGRAAHTDEPSNHPENH